MSLPLEHQIEIFFEHLGGTGLPGPDPGQFPREPRHSNGIYNSMNFLLRSLVLVIVGMAGDTFGLQTAFMGSAAISLLGLVGILMLPSENV